MGKIDKNKIKLLEINSESKYIDDVKKIYFNSFPKNERLDFNDLLPNNNEDGKLLAVTYDDELLGFSYIRFKKEFAYIIYLAIHEKYRNNGIGSETINKIIELFYDKTKVLCVEKPYEINDLRTRRINFYKRNNFNLADFQFYYEGEIYNVMYNGNFNNDSFIEFLKLCFPTCKDFKKIGDGGI